MKKKRPIFSGRLFAEGFVRLKITGLVGLALILCIRSFDFDGAELAVLFLVPVMMEQLFGFVNRRADSDFYYAAPRRRITFFLSYGTAVLLWIMIFAVLSQIKFLLEDARSWGSFAETLRAYYWQTMWDTCAMGILVMGAMAVAMSLTGTVSTNIVTAMLILFGPRLIMDLAIQNYYAMVPLVRVGDWVGRFFRPSSQLAYRLFANLTNGYALLRIGYSTSDFGMNVIHNINISGGVSSEYGGLPVWFAALYSAALGFLYLILGGVLFVKRKSEAAEKNGGGRFARTMTAAGLMLVFTLSGTFLLTRRLIHQSGEGISVIPILALWVLGIGSCLFYQRISGGKKNGKRTLAGILPAVVVVNAVVCLLFVKGTQAVLADVPEAPQIESVTVYLPESGFFQDVERDVLYLIGRRSFSSDEIRQIVSDSLKKEIDVFRESEQAFSDYRKKSRQDEFITITCQKDGEPRQMERRLILTDGQQKAFEEAMADELADVYVDAVNLKRGVWYNSLACNMCCRNFSHTQLQKVYDCLREEIKEKELPVTIYMGKKYNKENVFDFMESSLNNFALPVSVSTPKTVEMIADTGNEAAKSGLSITDFVERMGEEPYKETAKLFFILYDQESENGLSYGRYEFMSDEDRQRIAQLGDMLKVHKEQEITMYENVLYVRYGYDNTGLTEENGCWYNLSGEETARLKELLACHPYDRSEMTE